VHPRDRFLGIERQGVPTGQFDRHVGRPVRVRYGKAEQPVEGQRSLQVVGEHLEDGGRQANTHDDTVGRGPAAIVNESDTSALFAPEQSILNRVTSIAASSHHRIRVDLLTLRRGHFELRFAAEMGIDGVCFGAHERIIGNQRS
jgi:hypothetical protein